MSASWSRIAGATPPTWSPLAHHSFTDFPRKVESARPVVQALASARRARQASERRGHRHRARTHRVHVGDREGGAAHGIASPPEFSGRRRGAAPVYRVALVHVKRRRQSILVPRSRQARDGSQSGGTQPTDLSRINRRCDWPRLGADIRSHINVSNEPRAAATSLHRPSGASVGGPGGRCPPKRGSREAGCSSEPRADAQTVTEQNPLFHLCRQDERPPAVRDPRIAD